MKLFVTGGAGFIGSHLVRALVARGDTVTVFDNLSTGRRENVPTGTPLVEGDVTDLDALQRAMDGHDALVHLAARVAIRSSFEFAVEDTHANVVGTAAVMRAAQRSGSIRRVLATSSMAVYADSPTPVPITESHPTAPVSPYGISKLALEQLVHAMAAGTGIGSIVLRLFNTYGEGQALSPYVGVVTIFTHAVERGDVPTIFGDGEQCRDFVHVDDIVQAALLGIDSPISGETFNVGTGLATTVSSVCAMVQEALGTVGPVRHAAAAAGELRYSIADVGKARRLLGYAPERSLAEALPGVVRAIATRAAP